jgi:hypothetical protein
MNGPEFAAHALALQVLVDWRREAGVQKNKIKGRANPGNGGDDVDPAQQQFGPG